MSRCDFFFIWFLQDFNTIPEEFKKNIIQFQKELRLSDFNLRALACATQIAGSHSHEATNISGFFHHLHNRMLRECITQFMIGSLVGRIWNWMLLTDLASLLLAQAHVTIVVLYPASFFHFRQRPAFVMLFGLSVARYVFPSVRQMLTITASRKQEGGKITVSHYHISDMTAMGVQYISSTSTCT